MEDSVPIRARKALDHYLEENKLRKTPERYAILDAIYHIKGAFALEDLSKSLIEQNFRVSRATLYNTIRFFLNTLGCASSVHEWNTLYGQSGQTKSMPSGLYGLRACYRCSDSCGLTGYWRCEISKVSSGHVYFIYIWSVQ